MGNTNKSTICIEKIDKDHVEHIPFDLLSSPESLLKLYYKTYPIKPHELPSPVLPLDFKVALILHSSFPSASAVIIDDYLYFISKGDIIVLSPTNTVTTLKPFRRIMSSNWSICSYDGYCYILIPQTGMIPEGSPQVHFRDEGFDIIDQSRTVPVLLKLKNGEIVDQYTLPSLGVAPAQFYPSISAQLEYLVISTNNHVYFFRDTETAPSVVSLKSPVTSIASFKSTTIAVTQDGIVSVFEGSLPTATCEVLSYTPTFFEKLTSAPPPSVIINIFFTASKKKTKNIVIRDSEGLIYYLVYNKLDRQLLLESNDSTRYITYPFEKSPLISFNAPYTISHLNMKSVVSQSPFTVILPYKIKTDVSMSDLYYELKEEDFTADWSLIVASVNATYATLVFSVEEIHPTTVYDDFVCLGPKPTSAQINQIFRRPIMNSQLMMESLHVLVINQHLQVGVFSSEDFERYLMLSETKKTLVRHAVVTAMRENRLIEITQDTLRELFASNEELSSLMSIESSINTLLKNIVHVLDEDYEHITIASTLLVQQAPLLIPLDLWAKKFSPNNVMIGDLIVMFRKLAGEVESSNINVRESVLGVKIPIDILLDKFALFISKYSAAQAREALSSLDPESYLAAHTPVYLFDSLQKNVPIVSQIYAKPQCARDCNHVILLWTYFMFPDLTSAPTRPISSNEFKICLKFLGYLPKYVSDLFNYTTTEDDMRSSLFKVLVSHQYYADNFNDPLYKLNWKLVRKGLTYNLASIDEHNLRAFIDTYLEFIHFKTTELPGLISILSLVPGSVKSKVLLLLKSAYQLESIAVIENMIACDLVQDGWIVDEDSFSLSDLKDLMQTESQLVIRDSYRNDISTNDDYATVTRKATFISELHQNYELDSSIYDAILQVPSISLILIAEHPSYQLFVYLLSKGYQLHFRNITAALSCFCLDDDITRLKLSILCSSLVKNDKFAFEHIQNTSPGVIYDLLSEDITDFEMNLLREAFKIEIFSWNHVLTDIASKFHIPILQFMLTGENTLKFDTSSLQFISSQALFDVEKSISFTPNQLYLLLKNTILENDSDSIYNSLICFFQKCRSLAVSETNQAFTMLCKYAVATCNMQLISFCAKLAISVNMNGVLKIDICEVHSIIKSISRINGSLIPPSFDQLSVCLRMAVDYLITQDEDEHKKFNYAMSLNRSLMKMPKLFMPMTYSISAPKSVPCEIHYNRLADYINSPVESIPESSVEDIDSYQLGLGFASLFKYFANTSHYENALECARYARLRSISLDADTINEKLALAIIDDSHLIDAVEELSKILPENEDAVKWEPDNNGYILKYRDLIIPTQLLVKIALTKNALVKVRTQWLLIHLAKIKACVKNKDLENPTALSFDQKKFSESIKKTKGFKKLINWI